MRRREITIGEPPRMVPLLVWFRLVAGGPGALTGWFFLLFGMFFFWVFDVPGVVEEMIAFRDGAVEQVEGVIVASEETNSEVNENEVWAHHYEYTPPDGPPLAAIQGPKNLDLVAHIGNEGIFLRTGAGAVAKGCNELGSSVTVPLVDARPDWDALAGCLQRIKAAYPTETQALLSAANDMPYRDVLRLMDELRGARGRVLFPDTNLGFPRTTKETP